MMSRLSLHLLFLFAGVASGCTSTSNQRATPGGPDAEVPVEAGDSGAFDSGSTLDPRFFDSDVEDDDVFTHHNPEPSKIDVAALEGILNEAAAQQSDSVVVALGDSIVAEKYFGHTPTLATIQSITKSVVSLEIGALVESGKIPSLDVLVSTYFAEWASGDKAKVTLRHLLAHTSGLQDDGSNLFGQQDALAYARAQPLVALPGAVFSYSNVGSMLLAGIVKRAGGDGADILVRDRFLTPMGIAKWKWGKYPAGNVMTPGGLFLSPRDLLRLGRLVREHGSWNQQSLVGAKWIADSTTAPSAKYECYALHWWLLRDGCNADTGLSGKAGPIQGVLADGWGGNYLAVVPSSQVVAVRTKTPANATVEVVRKTAFSTFPHEIATLVK